VNVSSSRKAGKGGAKTRILIVDDHPIVREGLAQTVNSEADMEVCGQADDAPIAISLVKQLKPDVAIVDISLKGTSGLDLIKDIGNQWPRVQVLVLSLHDETIYAERCLRAGARGYLMKAEPGVKVLEAIRRIRDGRVYLSQQMSERLLDRLGENRSEMVGVDSLSDRELEVFRLLGEGYSAADIGARLHLSPKTIETYREHIKRKLNIETAAEVLQYAIRWAKSEDKC
jgi:DNA-binding NarL/FixJ family response regulator